MVHVLESDFFVLSLLDNLMQQMEMPHRQKLAPSNPSDLPPRESSTLESLAKLHRQSVITVAKAGVMGRD